MNKELAAILAAIAAEEESDELLRGRQVARSNPTSETPTGPAPLFSSAEIGTVDASTVVVTFDQNITASNYATGVTIKKNTAAQTISSATRQADHAVVHYVLADPAEEGDELTWQYTGGNIAAEDDGAPLGTVTAQTITNNITGDVMLSATITLTDAQIKATDTLYTLVPATETLNYTGAPTQLPIPVHAFVTMHSANGAYANVGANPAFVIAWGDWDYDVLKCRASQLDSASSSRVTVMPYRNHSTLDTATPAEMEVHSHILPTHEGSNLADSLLNNALSFALSNDAGDLTDGHASNTLTVTVIYYIATL